MVQPFELLGALLGAIFVALGAGAVLLSRLRTSRAGGSLLAFGAFVILYGARLIVRSEVVRQAFGIPEDVSHGVESAITYWILVPLGMLVESLLGRGRWGLLRRAWQVTTVYATGAVVWDLVTRTPGAAMGLNPVAVFANMAIAIPHAVSRHWHDPWTREGRVLAAAGALFAAVAAWETLFGGVFGRVDLEPVTMLVLVTALGAFVAARVFASERRLAAVSQELDTARQIQESILPRRMPVLSGVRVAARYLPTGAIAGDLYDLVGAPDGALGVLVADVSGHGVPAALIASMVKVALAAELEHAADPARVLAGMNRALCGKFERAYVTAVFAHLEPGGRRIRYSIAGHPPPIVRRAKGRVQLLEGRGLVLGFDPRAAYVTADAALAPGDHILFCTDGLLEAERDGALFGEGEFQQWLERVAPDSVDAFADAIVHAARLWARRVDAPLSDDLTLVVVGVT